MGVIDEFLLVISKNKLFNKGKRDEHFLLIDLKISKSIQIGVDSDQAGSFF